MKRTTLIAAVAASILPLAASALSANAQSYGYGGYGGYRRPAPPVVFHAPPRPYFAPYGHRPWNHRPYWRRSHHWR